MTWISFKQCCTSGSYLPVDQRRFHSPINTCQAQLPLLEDSRGIGFQYEQSNTEGIIPNNPETVLIEKKKKENDCIIITS